MNRFIKPALRISIIIAIILAVVIATYNIWYPRVAGLYAMWLVRNIDIPAIEIIPKEFTDDIQAGKASFIFQNIAFETPWSTIDNRREGEGYLALISNNNQNKVILLESVPIYANTFEQVASEFPERDVESMWPFHDEYSLYRHMLQISKDDLKPVTNPRDFLMYQYTIALFKGVYFLKESTTTNEFTNKNGMRGFEFKTSATSSLVSLFTPDDTQYDVVITGTESERDSVIQSFKMIE